MHKTNQKYQKLKTSRYLNDPLPQSATGNRSLVLFGPTRTDGLELIHIEFLINKPNQKIYAVRRGQIDLDFVHVEPNEQPLDLNTLEVGDRAVLELPSDFLVVVDQIIELDVTGLVELDNEGSVVGGERVGFDGVGEEAAREAVFGEELVDGWAVGGGEGEDVEREEEEEREEVGGFWFWIDRHAC